MRWVATFFIANLLVRIHFIIVMIRWTGLAPWEFEFPFPGSLTSTFLEVVDLGFEGAEDAVVCEAVAPVRPHEPCEGVVVGQRTPHPPAVPRRARI